MFELRSKGWHNLSMVLMLILLVFGCERNGKEDEQPEQSEPVASEINQSEKILEEPAAVNETKPDILPVGEETMSEAEMWKEYKSAKDAALAAKEKGNLEDLKLALLRAASFAKKLNRPDIVTWQLNNIGYYSILEFKKRTEYDVRMRTIETMKYDETKIEYIQQTREIFQKQMPLLTVAEKHLNDALEFDNKLEDENRTEKIYSNLKFIEWVRKFTTRKYESQQGQ